MKGVVMEGKGRGSGRRCAAWGGGTVLFGFFSRLLNPEDRKTYSMNTNQNN